MKRRSFVKQSVSAAVLTPLAFSGLINAAGATEGGTDNTTVPETTDWFTSDPGSTGIEYTSEVHPDHQCRHQGVTPKKWQKNGVWYCAVPALCGTDWNDPKGYRSPKTPCVVGGVDQCYIDPNSNRPPDYHELSGPDADNFDARIECAHNV